MTHPQQLQKIRRNKTTPDPSLSFPSQGWSEGTPGPRDVTGPKAFLAGLLLRALQQCHLEQNLFLGLHHQAAAPHELLMFGSHVPCRAGGWFAAVPARSTAHRHRARFGAINALWSTYSFPRSIGLSPPHEGFPQLFAGVSARICASLLDAALTPLETIQLALQKPPCRERPLLPT